VLDILFHALVRYAAPVLVFTAEEVWASRYPDAESVHLLEWPEVDAGWTDLTLAERWNKVRIVRTWVNEDVEPHRRAKAIGSSLDADISLDLEPDLHSLHDIDWPEVLITAPTAIQRIAVTSRQMYMKVGGEGAYKYREGARIAVAPTTHHKCGRCWRHLPEVSEDGALCGRCEDVISNQ
jgi:isoleucyl-tRNA synthetase